MSEDRALAAVVLAAGPGTRLRPLTLERPKALCPVDNVALVDQAVARAEAVTSDVAVNVHAGRRLMEEHLGARVHVSVEEPEALGTAGALAQLRDWIAGRPVLVQNADAWLPVDLRAFVAGWDGERIRLLTVVEPSAGDWGDRQYAGAGLLPWPEVARLPLEASGLFEASWRHHAPGDALELVDHDGPHIDCGTPARYLAANLAAAGGPRVVGREARVDGELVRGVVWDDAVVHRGERLVDAIRTSTGRTVLVR